MKIRICIVDDDPSIADGLMLLLRSDAEIECAGAFQAAEAALRAMPALDPDVVLMDINLGHSSGIDCVRKLKQLAPRSQVLMLTVYEDSEKIFQSLIAGASGYLLKRMPKADLRRSIIEVYHGGAPMPGNIARKVVQYFQQSPARPEFETLTAREHEVLEQLARGAMYKEIADTLGIALDTVRHHIRKIYEKLHVRSRTEAVLKYLNK